MDNMDKQFIAHMNLTDTQQRQKNCAQISNKRQQFYFQIRERMKLQTMRHIRCQFLDQQKNKALQKLISQTIQEVNKQQFVALTYYAKNNLTNAIIHIGNLFIDEILNYQIFQQVNDIWLYQLNPSSGYLQWLLLILLSNKQIPMSFQIFQKMLESIIRQKTQNQFRLLNCIKCLIYLVKNYKQQFVNKMILQLWANKKQYNVLILLKNNFSKNFQISKQSWKLTNYIFNQQNNEISLQLINLYSIDKFLQLIQFGLMSVHPHIRAQGCQIFNNNIQILICKIQSQKNVFILKKIRQFLDLCYNLVCYQNQKISVKIQISYLLFNYLQKCSIKQIVYQIQRGLVKVILKMLQISKSGHNIQFTKNCHDICKFIVKTCEQYQCTSLQEKQLVNRIFCEMNSQGIFNFSYSTDQQVMEDVY